MKRKLALVITLIVILMIFIQPFPGKKPQQAQETSLTNIEEVPVVETPVEAITEAPSVKPEADMQEVAVAPIIQKEAPALSIEAVPEEVEAVEESVPEEVSYEDESVSIVMISVCESEESDVQFATVLPNNSNIKGFRILGNANNLPLDLVVKSRDIQGCEKVHFLDWNVKHPNEFDLYDALGNDTTVGIYSNEVQVARFTVPVNAQNEYVALDLNQGNSQLAFAR